MFSIPSFDDSEWNNAVVIPGQNDHGNEKLNGYGQWIWTSGYRNEEHMMAYCRKTLVPGEAPGETGKL